MLALQPSQLDHVHSDLAERRAIAERDHEIEDAGGYKFRLEFRVEVLRRKPERRCEFLLVDLRGFEDRLPLRHGDTLRTTALKTDFHRQNPRPGLLKNVNAAFLSGNHAK